MCRQVVHGSDEDTAPQPLARPGWEASRSQYPRLHRTKHSPHQRHRRHHLLLNNNFQHQRKPCEQMPVHLSDAKKGYLTFEAI